VQFANHVSRCRPNADLGGDLTGRETATECPPMQFITSLWHFLAKLPKMTSLFLDQHHSISEVLEVGGRRYLHFVNVSYLL